MTDNQKLHYLNDYLNSNGLRENYIVLGEEDNIYIPFKYTYVTTSDLNVKSNYEIFLKYYYDNNVVIDFRMTNTITYIASQFPDILIYDISNNMIITFNTYVKKKLFTGQQKLFKQEDLINIMLLYTFIKFYCKNLHIQWNSTIAIKAVINKKFLKNALNINIIIDYFNMINLQHLNSSSNYVQIAKKIKIQDDIRPFKLANKTKECNLSTLSSIINELNYINKNSSFILLF